MPKSPDVVCFLSSKGGSGKTVTSASLGTLLSGLGFRVLLVDTDAATNGMTLLFLEQLLRDAKPTGIQRNYGLFEAPEGVRPTPLRITNKLSLVPATYRMIDTERVDVTTLKASLELTISKAKEYDFILIDAQAGTDPYAQVAASLSELHIIVSEYDPVSAQGIDRLKVLFSNELSSTNTYVLFNKVLPEFASVIGEGLSIARYLPPIPWDADVVRAFAQRDLAISFELPNPYTLAVAQIALSSVPDTTGPAIEEWRGEAYFRQTDPIKRRLDYLYEVRKKLRKDQAARSRRRSLLDMLPMLVVALIALGTAVIPVLETVSGRKILSDSYSPMVLLVLLTLTMIIMTFSQITRDVDRPVYDDSEDIQDEITKLEANMVAAKAALRATSPGPFAALRRHVIHGDEQR